MTGCWTIAVIIGGWQLLTVDSHWVHHPADLREQENILNRLVRAKLKGISYSCRTYRQNGERYARYGACSCSEQLARRLHTLGNLAAEAHRMLPPAVRRNLRKSRLRTCTSCRCGATSACWLAQLAISRFRRVTREFCWWTRESQR